MIILKSTYIADKSILEQHLDAHLAWVEEGYSRGNFLVSGLRDGGEGAIIALTGMTTDDVAAFLARDPFVVNNVSVYEVIEFETARTAQGFPTG